MLVNDLHLTKAAFQWKWFLEKIFSKWFFANLWSWAPSLSCQWDTLQVDKWSTIVFNSFIQKKTRELQFCSFFVHLSIILVNIIKHIRSLEMLQFPHQQQTNNRSLFWNRDWSYPQLWLASIWNSIELIFLKRGLHWHFRKFLKVYNWGSSIANISCLVKVCCRTFQGYSQALIKTEKWDFKRKE
jgi:hypothetical protein